MKNQTLETEFSKALSRQGVLSTRLRTPNYGYRGVRYPADFVVWGEQNTFLVECKQRKSFPLAPSDIRQLPFMKEWVSSSYLPKAAYLILVKADGIFALFTAFSAVAAEEAHKGLKVEQAIFYAESIDRIVDFLIRGYV